MVKTLVAAGADVNARDDFGETPLEFLQNLNPGASCAAIHCPRIWSSCSLAIASLIAMPAAFAARWARAITG